MSNKMWGGRFASGPAEIMEEINASIDFDRKLGPQDIMASQAHLAMLAAQGIVEAADAEAIANGLAQVKGEIEAGTFSFKRALEGELLGPAGLARHLERRQFALGERREPRCKLRRVRGAIGRGLAGRSNRPV